jgi:hypothetical protein
MAALGNTWQVALYANILRRNSISLSAVRITTKVWLQLNIKLQRHLCWLVCTTIVNIFNNRDQDTIQCVVTLGPI